jgi:hypothetical protein
LTGLAGLLAGGVSAGAFGLSWLAVWDTGSRSFAGGGGAESSIRLSNGDVPALAWLERAELARVGGRLRL